MKLNEDEMELLASFLDNPDLMKLLLKIMQAHYDRHAEVFLGEDLVHTTDRELCFMKARLEGAKRALIDFRMGMNQLKKKQSD